MPEEVVVENKEDALDKAIEDAEDKVEAKDDKDVDTKDEKIEGTKDEDDEESLEAANALELFRALKGKDGVKVIQQLAQKAGLIGDETKKEEKKAILKVLEEELGDEYVYLAPRFAKALETILNQEIGSIRNESRQVELNRKKAEADSALDKFYSDHPDVKAIEPLVLKLMNKFPQGEVDTYEYLEGIYNLAKFAKNGKASSSVKKALDKIVSNSKEANLKSSSDVDETRVRKGPQRPTLDQALEAASKGIRFED